MRDIKAFKCTAKKATAIVLLAVFVLSATACGSIKDMFNVLDGGDNSGVNISHAGNDNESSEDVKTEIPETPGDMFVTTANGNGVAVTDYIGTEPIVKIPAQIGGKTVLAVNAIKDTQTEDGAGVTITQIIVPDTVTSIAKSAFSGCKSLQSLTVPFVGGKVNDSNKYVGYVFGSSNASLPEALAELYVGGEKVEASAFKDCKTLKTIVLKDVTTVGANAFDGCAKLETLIIPDTVTSIGKDAFAGCDSLKKLSLPYLGNGSDKLFFGAIFGAPDYKHNIDYVPQSLRSVTLAHNADIPAGAFYECNGITELVVNGAVTSVGEKAFYRCKKLKTFTVNGGDGYGGIKQLAIYAFGYCSALGTVNLDATVTIIPEGAFYGCSSLRTVRFGTEENVMPSTVTKLGKAAFAYCESLAAMELSTGLNTVEEQAFYGCAYLLSVKLPSSVLTVGTEAFKGCSHLKTLTIEGDLMLVEDGAFSYCTSLAAVSMPQSLAVIGDNAFAYCASLADVTVKCNTVKLGENAFSGCPKIVVSVDFNSQSYISFIEAGLGNSNLKDLG